MIYAQSKAMVNIKIDTSVYTLCLFDVDVEVGNLRRDPYQWA